MNHPPSTPTVGHYQRVMDGLRLLTFEEMMEFADLVAMNLGPLSNNSKQSQPLGAFAVASALSDVASSYSPKKENTHV